MMTVYFINTGDIHSLTGGYLYNMHIINGLKNKGYTVNLLGIHPEGRDWNSLETSCRSLLKNIPYGSRVIVDSLVIAPMHRVIQEFGKSLKFLGLMHLPLSYDIFSGVHRIPEDNELQAMHHMHRVVVTGQFTFHLLCDSGLNPAKIRIAGPGTENFPRKGQYKPVPSQLLCIANYSAVKAQDVLIRALYRLKDRTWTLHLHGNMESDKDYAESIGSLIRKLKLEHRIIMHGIVERHNLSGVFLDADLFVLPSLFESYGMALAESLAHGIPVLTTRAGNIPYTVPAAMGLFTEPANEQQLADAILSLLDDPVKYSSLCSAASTYYLQARSWDQAITDFEMILQETD